MQAKNEVRRQNIKIEEDSPAMKSLYCAFFANSIKKVLKEHTAKSIDSSKQHACWRSETSDEVTVKSH